MYHISDDYHVATSVLRLSFVDVMIGSLTSTSKRYIYIYIYIHIYVYIWIEEWLVVDSDDGVLWNIYCDIWLDMLVLSMFIVLVSWVVIWLETIFSTADRMVLWNYFNVVWSVVSSFNSMSLHWVFTYFCTFSSVDSSEFYRLSFHVVTVSIDNVD